MNHRKVERVLSAILSEKYHEDIKMRLERKEKEHEGWRQGDLFGENVCRR